MGQSVSGTCMNFLIMQDLLQVLVDTSQFHSLLSAPVDQDKGDILILLQ